MPKKLPVPPDQISPYATEAELSAIIKIPIMTLRRWRREARGPPYRKFGSRVLYHIEESLAWAEAQRCTSTSENAALRARAASAERAP